MPDLDVELPRNALAPGLGRRHLADWLSGALEADDVERARLLVSELVANAVVHGEGRIRLRSSLAEDRKLLVEVIDEGAGLEDAMRERDFGEVGGYGLMIVEAEAGRWGVHEGTTHVWFELEPTGPRLGAVESPLA